MAEILITIGLLISVLISDSFTYAFLAVLVLYLFFENKKINKQFQKLKNEFSLFNQQIISNQTIESTKTEPSASSESQKEKQPSQSNQLNQTNPKSSQDVITESLPIDILQTKREHSPWEIHKSQTEQKQANTISVNKSQPSQPGQTNQWLKRIIEFATTGNLTVKAGIVVLFFGVAFLLKYAADNSLLPIEFRLTAVAISAFALGFVGWRLKEKNHLYSLILQGGSIAILYLTTYTSFKLYDVVTIELGFVLLIIIMASALFLALYQDAKALAFVGAAGGFMAPIVASTGDGNHIVLFSYYAVLNFSIFAISWFKSWRSLNLLGFVMTFVIGVLWGVLQYHPNHFSSTEFFLILFFLLYIAISILHAVKQPPNLKGLVDGTLLFGPPIIGVAIQAFLVEPYAYGIAYSTMILGTFYLGLAAAIYKKYPHELKTLYEAFFALSVIFFTLTIPLLFDNNWSSAAWAIEGAGVIWISLRQQKTLSLIFGLLVLLGASMLYVMVVLLNLQAHDLAFFNPYFMGGLMIALSSLFSAYFLFKAQNQLFKSFIGIDILLLLWGLVWWFSSAWREIDTFVPKEYASFALLAHLALTAIIVIMIEVRYQWTTLKHSRLSWLLLLSATLYLSFFTQSHPFANYAMAGWLLNAYLFYRILYWFENNLKDQLSHPLTLHAFSFGLFIALLSYEAQWLAQEYYSQWIIHSGLMALLPILIGLHLINKSLFWPFERHQHLYTNLIAWPIVAIIVIWNLTLNLHSAGGAMFMAFIPFLNLLEIVTLVSLWLVYQWWKQPERSNLLEVNTWSPYLAGLVVFLVINAIILRALYHWFDVNYAMHEWMQSTLTQATLSITWSILGFMVISAANRIQSRKLWIAGSALLGLVLLKVFTIDLASTGSIARIVSFIAVGGILLVIGYLYPIPPNSKTERITQAETKENTEAPSKESI